MQVIHKNFISFLITFSVKDKDFERLLLTFHCKGECWK